MEKHLWLPHLGRAPGGTWSAEKERKSLLAARPLSPGRSALPATQAEPGEGLAAMGKQSWCPLSC